MNTFLNFTEQVANKVDGTVQQRLLFSKKAPGMAPCMEGPEKR
jgi:hypothetical protein